MLRYYWAVLCRAGQQWKQVQKRWLPLEAGSTVGLAGIYAALVLPAWAFPHPTQEELPALYALIACFLFLALALGGSFVWATLKAPAYLHGVARLKAARSETRIAKLEQRVSQLEEERKPKIELAATTKRGSVGEQEDASWALVRVSNTGAEMLEDCYCRLIRVEWRSGALVNAGQKYYWIQRFENEEVFFHWRGQAAGERHHSFRNDALVEIVLSGTAHSRLANADDRGFPLIHGDPHKITVEVGARNSEPRIATFGMRMRSAGYWIDEDGHINLIRPQPPPFPVFEKAKD